MRGIGALLNRLQGVKKAGDGFLARCPAHEDKRQSLSVGVNHDKLLVNCHAGCTTEAVMAALSLTVKDLFLDSATPGGPARLSTPPAPEKLVCAYDYTDAAGTLLYQVCRFEPKSFRQRRPDGTGGWLWDMKGVERVLYRLPAVMEAETVYLVEGEKDADNLSALGLVATTSPGGASAWRADYAACLKGRKVVIVPDQDEAGHRYAKDAAASLWNVAREVEVILLPKSHKDVSDYLAAGGDIVTLLSSAQPLAALYGDDRPEVVETVAGRSFTWGQYGVRIEVTHLHQHQDGRVTGELIVSRLNQPGGHHLHQAQFNFSASTSRERLAAMLGKRPAGAGVDWPELFEQLCLAVLEWARAGEPVQELDINDEDIPAPAWVCAPFLMEGLPTVMFGEKGVAKSTIAIALALTLDLNWLDNPWGWDLDQSRIHRPLILDWEQEGGVVRYWAKQLRLGNGIPHCTLLYRHCAQPLALELPAIQEHIAATGADVLILDSLGAACGGELNKSEPALAFWAALRSLHRTALILAQTSKTQDDKKTIMGSTYFGYYARSIIECARSEAGGADKSFIGLFHREANYVKKFAPIEFQMDFSGREKGEGISLSRVKFDAKHWENKVPVATRLLEYLKNGAMTPKNLADITGINQSTVRVTLARMRDGGRAVKLQGDLWGLPEQE